MSSLKERGTFDARAMARQANVTDEAAATWQLGGDVTRRTADRLEEALNEMLAKPARHMGGSRPPVAQAAIVAVLMDGPATSKAIASCCGKLYATVTRTLNDMKHMGVVAYDAPVWSICNEFLARRILWRAGGEPTGSGFRVDVGLSHDLDRYEVTLMVRGNRAVTAQGKSEAQAMASALADMAKQLATGALAPGDLVAQIGAEA